MTEKNNINPKSVTLYCELNKSDIDDLIKYCGLSISKIASSEQDIPGSYWGESEAGLVKNTLYVREDTPIHSLLHETCHYICMDKQRREQLDTNAGGDYDEENAVCYLQILLSDKLEHFNRNIMFNDMDNWGYTFRLGSAKRWFEQDATDAKDWLISNNIINRNEQLIVKK